MRRGRQVERQPGDADCGAGGASHPDARPGHRRLRGQLLGVGAASPAGRVLTAALHLTPFQQSLLVAVPVVVGSLGRIPVGALTDRFGGRVMFPVVSLATVVPVLYLGLFGHSSLAALLVGGFFLGIAGTAFAVGVPFVSAWFPPERRGFAVGVFGAGMGGTAISALTTVKLANAHASQTPFVITAVVLAGVRRGRRAGAARRPGPAVPTGSLAARLARAAAARSPGRPLRSTRSAFGGYVAFSVYLPTYLKNAYGLTPADASNRMAGFVVVAVADAAGRRLALGPGRAGPGADGRLRRGRRRRARPVVDPGPAPARHDRVPGHGRGPRRGAGATFALVAQRAPADKVGARHRHRRRGRRPRRLRPAAGDGLDLRPLRATTAIGLLLLARWPRWRAAGLHLADPCVARPSRHA